MTDSEGNEIGKLFIGGLSQATNNASLRLYFSRFGEVDDAVVMMDNKTGRSRGFGYVKYREPDAVILALEAKPHILDGKEVDAKQCNINMKGRNRRSLKIFVGGIGLDQDADSIRNFFKQFGRVTDVNLMMDSNKQRHRGFAFVGFEDESVVKRLINLHYVMMNTKQVEIKAMEPPNFGRKVIPNGCLASAAIMNNANSSDGSCGQTFEPGTDCNSIIPASFVNTIPYMPAQHPALHCLPSNIIAQTTRPHSTGLYDQTVGAYSTNLDTIYQSATILQTMNHPNKGFESIQGSENCTVAKQSTPFVVAGGHNQQSTLNQSMTPVYTAFPYQFVPSSYIPTQQPTMSGVSQLVGMGKPGSTWPSVQAGSVTICQPHVPTTNNLISCPPFAPAQSTTLQNSQHGDINGAVTPVITPYYTICSQYAALPLPNEHSIATAYTVPQVPTVGNTNTLKIQGSGTTDKIASGSRVSTPVNDTRIEQARASKLAYPTVMLPGPGSLQNSAMVSPAGQTMWNQAHPNLVYSPLQFGWAFPTNSQHNWTSSSGSLTQLQSATCFDAAITKPANPINGEAQQKTQENEVQQQIFDDAKVTQAKASGDGLDTVIPTSQGNKSSEYNSHGRIDSVDLTRIPGTIHDPGDKSNEQSRIWPSENSMSSASWSDNPKKWTQDKKHGTISTPSQDIVHPWNRHSIGSNEDRSEEKHLGELTYTNNTSTHSKMTQLIRTATGCSKGDKDTSSANQNPSKYQSTQIRPTCRTQNDREHHSGSQVPEDPNIPNELQNRNAYTEYATWLYRKSTGDLGHSDKSVIDRKQVHSNMGIEFDCQGPAGAAGDFHRPIHTSQYHMTR